MTVGPMSSERPILLDDYAARSCPVKTHNAYDVTLRVNDDTSAMRTHSEALLEIFAGSDAYDQTIFARIVAAAEGVVDLRPLADESSVVREAATAEAVASGAAVIISPTVPRDYEGHRRGQPDLLVRGTDNENGPGYLPVKFKRATVLQRRPSSFGPQWVSELSTPTFADARPLANASFRESRQPDLLQLAHYWRMLEAMGWASDQTPTGGIVGRDRLPQLASDDDVWFDRAARRGAQPIEEQVISWFDLCAKMFRTFARTAAEGYRYRSALERYDHEHGFRVMVAQVAQQRTGSPDDPAPRVTPIVVNECTHCQWWSICEPQLHADDLSLRIAKSRLDVREISVLRSLGISTISDLAEADLAELLPIYLPEVTHRQGAEERIELAARRARLLAKGIELERRTPGPIDCPRADIEIDFDIETSSGDRVYLWGFLVHDRAASTPPRYVSFSRFTALDEAAERELADEALTWLHGMLTANPSTLIYHYSNYEINHIEKLVTPDRKRPAAHVLDDHRAQFVDLFDVIRGHFFGAHGLGLKVVAHAATGFNWRDDDPGGLNSQAWFSSAVSGETEAERAEAAERVLVYNEDDVRATHAVRAWLTALDASEGADEQAE